MTNVEKVIKNLNTIVACCKLFTNKKTCSGIDEEMYADWANDIGEAVFLLKEQEPVPPKKQNWYQAEWPSFESWWYVCGACGGKIDYHDRFCRLCGRSVKWE